MLGQEPLASNEGWTLVTNMNVLPIVDSVLEQHSDIKILAIICHLMKQLPISFTDSNLVHFRANLTLSLYRNANMLL